MPRRRSPRTTGPARRRAVAGPRSSGCGVGLRPDRDGALGLRRPPGAARRASTRGRTPRWRPPRARSTVVLPAERGDILDRNGEPLADSVDGLMVVADPALTTDSAPEIARFLAERLSTSTTSTPWRGSATRAAGSSTSPGRCPRRWPTTSSTRPRRAGHRRPVDPARPGAHLPGPRRGGQPGRLRGHRRGVRRPGAGLRQAPLRHRRRGPLRGRRRQPDPARRPTRPCQAVDGADLHTTIDRDLQWYTQRVLRDGRRKAPRRLRRRGDHGLADRRGPRRRRLPDVRRRATRPTARPRTAAAAVDQPGATSPARWRRCSRSRSLIDAGRVDRADEVPGARAAWPARTGSIHDYFEHGTDPAHAGRASSPSRPTSAPCWPPTGSSRASCARYLNAFGLGQRTDVGLGGESAGHPARPGAVDRAGRGPDRVRSVAVGQRRPDGRRGQHHRQRRECGSRPAWSRARRSATTASRSAPTSPPTRRVVSADAARQTTLMMERVVDPEDGVAPRRRRCPATGSPARPAPRSGSAPSAAATTARSPSPSAGSRPADDPRFTIYVVIHNPRNGGGGGSVAGPVFSKLMGFALHRYGVAPSGRRRPSCRSPGEPRCASSRRSAPDHQTRTPSRIACPGDRLGGATSTRPRRPPLTPLSRVVGWLAAHDPTTHADGDPTTSVTGSDAELQAGLAR